MKKVKILNAIPAELQVLQEHVERYLKVDVATHIKDPDRYFEAILEASICKAIWRMLRTKMESDSKRFSLILDPEQAVILLLVCQSGYNAADSGSYSKNVALAYSNDLDEQLKSQQQLIVSPQYHLNA